MRAVVVGAGGIGRAMAGLLSHAGHDVTLVFRRQQDAQHVVASGLEVSGAVELTTSPACQSGVVHGQFDLAVLATKTYDTQRALSVLARSEIGMVLSVQNGLRKDGELSEYAPGRVIGAVIQIVAARSSRAGVHVSAIEPSFIGELDGSLGARIEGLAGDLTTAGIPTSAVSDIQSLQWSKLVSWIPSSLLSVVTRRALREIYEDPQLGRIYVDVAREIARVAAARGHPVVDKGAIAAACLTTGGPGATGCLKEMAAALRDGNGVEYRSSMLLDLLASRPLELDDTAGHVVKLAASSKVDVPVTRALFRLARSAADQQGNLDDR